MEVCGVYIEKIENKGRALWVLGVFAREKEGTMHVHTYVRARAPPLAAGRPAGAGAGAGPGSGSGSGSLPGLVLFESGSVGMGRTAPANCCRKTDRAVDRLRRFCPNRRNCCLFGGREYPSGAL